MQIFQCKKTQYAALAAVMCPAESLGTCNVLSQNGYILHVAIRFLITGTLRESQNFPSRTRS
jgi:hypothetical protein